MRTCKLVKAAESWIAEEKLLEKNCGSPYLEKWEGGSTIHNPEFDYGKERCGWKFVEVHFWNWELKTHNLQLQKDCCGRETEEKQLREGDLGNQSCEQIFVEEEVQKQICRNM